MRVRTVFCNLAIQIGTVFHRLGHGVAVSNVLGQGIPELIGAATAMTFVLKVVHGNVQDNLANQ